MKSNVVQFMRKLKAVITFKIKVFSTIILLLLIGYYFSLPKRLFKVPYATVLYSHDNQLLAGAIAADGQWRFPSRSHINKKYQICLQYFEDEYFRYHWGVNPVSMARALSQNLKQGQVVSGGSTITMQIIRMARKKPRNIIQKLIEMVLATRLEWRYSKDEILAIYAAHAPFGGNIVGLEAASWRYFGHHPASMSWAEAALLAVLPNQPGMVHPGKNQQHLLKKRNKLLSKLLEHNQIDSLSYQLALLETLPSKPSPIPQKALHLLYRAMQEGYDQQIIQSTLDFQLQNQARELVHAHYNELSENKINNVAAMIVEVASGNVLAYVGNVNFGTNNNGSEVDIIKSRRSTGSLLKPFLYAALLNEGSLLPQALVEDVPVFYGGFSPKNFTKKYMGLVPADEALAKSLNVPAVHMLHQYSVEKFHHLLRQMGMSTLDFAPNHYGLSLILGGAEGTLWDLTSMYASCARSLIRANQTSSKNRYAPLVDFIPNQYIGSADDKPRFVPSSHLNAASLWFMFNALTELKRPISSSDWKTFSSSKKIAWKTGTSYGHRDAWSIGVTPKYVVGVWAGNASGEGRPNLTGLKAAAPLMFKMFNLLPDGNWFKEPYFELTSIKVCQESGFKSNPHCSNIRMKSIPTQGVKAQQCPYHQNIFVDALSNERVNASCASSFEMVKKSWFMLPPLLEWYYKRAHSNYRLPPAWSPNCPMNQDTEKMTMIYPNPNAKLFLPIDLNGELNEAVFEVAHAHQNSKIFWHLDGNYLGSTYQKHQMPLKPSIGMHELVLVDATGASISVPFTILDRDQPE